MAGGQTAVGYFIGGGFVLFLVLRVPRVPSLFPDHPLSLSRALLSLATNRSYRWQRMGWEMTNTLCTMKSYLSVWAPYQSSQPTLVFIEVRPTLAHINWKKCHIFLFVNHQKWVSSTPAPTPGQRVAWGFCVCSTQHSAIKARLFSGFSSWHSNLSDYLTSTLQTADSSARRK